MLIRKPAVANLFYTGNPTELERQVNFFLESSVDVTLEGSLKTLIVPHAGYTYSGIVAGSAYRHLKKLDQNKNWKVILLGPSHKYPLNGATVCAYNKFLTPLGEIKVSDIAQELVKKLGFIPYADSQEHSLEVQLPFLQMSLKNFELIPIMLGRINVKALADLLKPYMDENTLLVISTDLSHFFTYEKAIEIDSICNKAIPSLDTETMMNDGDACGIYGVLTSMFLAKNFGWKGNFLDYKNSGDTGGDKTRVVGYGAYAFTNLTKID